MKDVSDNGAGYGYISEKYIEDFGTAYVVSTLPDPDGGSPPTASTCQYYCRDYGFGVGVCNGGWQCDAEGECLTQAAGGTCPMQ